MGVRLKEFSVGNGDKKTEEITKVVKIEEFSVFCDWKDFNENSRAYIDLKKLEEQDRQNLDTEFKHILNRNFSDCKEDLVNHMLLIDDFCMQANAQVQLFGIDDKKLEIPQIQASVHMGRHRNEALDGAGFSPHQPCPEDGLQFALHQPQILRILKTIEILGFYNEFKRGAQASFFNTTLTQL
jgi:hypothetical protein